MPHLSDVFLAIAAIPFIYYCIAGSSAPGVFSKGR